MLPKVDLMSMANSLEVRVPFLDFNLVNYVCSLPDEYKISGKMKKKILQDTFRNLLPAELYKRPKHGFEVPLAKWFKTELKSMIIDDLLSDDFIINQNIFNIEKIKELKSRLFMSNQGELPAQIWALIVFQYWWKKYFIA
jgi:asparagine synthase (glutamine-hydrolysing)